MILNIVLAGCGLLDSLLTDSVKLQLLNKTVHLKSGETTVTLDVQISNKSDSTLLLYNFNVDPDIAFREESFFCNSKIAARGVIFVYDERMNSLYARKSRIHDVAGYNSMPEEKLRNKLNDSRLKFRNSSQVIKPGEQMIFKRRANLQNVQFSKGTYYLKLIYSAGEYTSNMVSERDMSEDKAKHKAKIFKGCVSSDVIKLVVE